MDGDSTAGVDAGCDGGCELPSTAGVEIEVEEGADGLGAAVGAGRRRIAFFGANVLAPSATKKLEQPAIPKPRPALTVDESRGHSGRLRAGGRL